MNKAQIHLSIMCEVHMSWKDKISIIFTICVAHWVIALIISGFCTKYTGHQCSKGLSGSKPDQLNVPNSATQPADLFTGGVQAFRPVMSSWRMPREYADGWLSKYHSVTKSNHVLHWDFTFLHTFNTNAPASQPSNVCFPPQLSFPHTHHFSYHFYWNMHQESNFVTEFMPQ